MPPSGADLAAGRRFGPYQLEAELGRGGMGCVFRAWDPRLQRPVALKVLLLAFGPGGGASHEPTLSDEPQARFLREARLTAALQHRAVVTVYEVGEAEGVPYLAMELVEGRTLRDRFASAGVPEDLRERVRLVEETCRGVAHAHGHGVIHRDLKPANVLVAPDATGVPRAKVTDFGLSRARDEASPLTRTGQVIGTPSYMSPEHCAGGRSVDERSDVFSLGAILYEAAAGRQPFPGETPLEVMAGVVQRDPERPSRANPAVDAGLEGIVLRALEKEPGRRYGSAGELADDLERWRTDSAPIRAPRDSAARRLRRRMLRHPLAMLVTGVALASGLGLAVLAAAQRSERSRRANEAVAHGDAERAQDRAAQAREAYRTALALEPDWAEARAGLAWAEAELRVRAEAAEADRRRVEAAEAAVRSALAKAGRVQRVLARWVALAPTLARLDRSFHDSSLDETGKRVRGDALWPEVAAFLDATPEDATSRAAARALAGWGRLWTGHVEEGLAWLRESRALDPELPYGALFEALLWLNNYLALQGVPGIQVGKYGLEFQAPVAESADMVELRGKMERLLAEAERCPVWGEGMAEEFRRGLEAARFVSQGKYEEAERGLTAALGSGAMASFRTGLRFARARVRYVLGRFADGIADLEAVAEARPENADVRLFLGILRAGSARGEGAIEILGRAVSDFDAAVRLRSTEVQAYKSRGIALHQLGERLAERHEDARAVLERALADDGAALERAPGDADLHHNRAAVLVRRAEAEFRVGGDPRPWLDLAVADYGAALRLRPDYASARNGLGVTLWVRGDVERAGGADPLSWYRQAVAEYDASLAIRPDDRETRYNRASVWVRIGEAEAARGIDPRESCDRALADLDATLRGAPEMTEAYNNRAVAHLRKAEAEAGLGMDARESYAQAVKDLDEVVKRNPTDASAWSNRGAARHGAGRVVRARGDDPMEWFRGALADYDEALRRRPGFPNALRNRAEAWLSFADALGAAGQDPREALEKSAADYGESLRAAPADLVALVNRGTALGKLGYAERARGIDPRGAWERSLETFTEATRHFPASWQAHANRGLLLEELDRPREAVDAYAAALRLVPDQAQVLEWSRRAAARAAKPGTGDD